MKRSRSLKIRQTLEGTLNEFPAPTLVDLSRRLGYSTSAVLRAHAPDLCDLLARRRRNNVTKYRSDLKRAAKAALDETPIPSVRNLCKRLGVTVWFMGKYFPAVRHMIAEKRRRVASVAIPWLCRVFDRHFGCKTTHRNANLVRRGKRYA